mmetsp:Transcript_47706/g.102222  ORF Transcript_47706/g.102222 Transcript_47706/m.102222 type:complete len:287 (+) Transcript_47706:183-1043(+)
MQLYGLTLFGLWLASTLCRCGAVATIQASNASALTVDFHAGRDRGQNKETVVISSWATLTLLQDATSILKASDARLLAHALRNAVADSLDVCRSSVSVVDMKATNTDVVYDEDDGLLYRPQEITPSFLEHIQHLVRFSKPKRHHLESLKTTQARAVYEVRIFDEMRLSAAEVALRIDGLQNYNKFNHLNRLLRIALGSKASSFEELIHVDDIGYASRLALKKPPMSNSKVLDCLEEGFLNDARRFHEAVLFASIVIVILITCVGSAVFTIKQPSLVPSRLNPLVSD